MVRDYRRKKIKSYDYDQLSNLANDFAALKKKTSIRKFAKAKGIPYATAQRWIKQPPTKKPGHPTILTKEEENLLATALKFLGDSNMGQDRDDLANMVQAFIRTTQRPNPFHDGKPGIDWIRGFEKRHPEISQRTAEILTVARAKSLTPETVNIFFDKFEKILDDNQATNLRNQPGRIWNCDETGLTTNPKAKKLYSRQGKKDVYLLAANCGKTSYSVLVCGSAAGDLLPPFTVYKGKNLYKQWMQGQGLYYSRNII